MGVFLQNIDSTINGVEVCLINFIFVLILKEVVTAQIGLL
jgi:hypothetical protein